VEGRIRLAQLVPWVTTSPKTTTFRLPAERCTPCMRSSQEGGSDRTYARHDMPGLIRCGKSFPTVEACPPRGQPGGHSHRSCGLPVNATVPARSTGQLTYQHVQGFRLPHPQPLARDPPHGATVRFPPLTLREPMQLWVGNQAEHHGPGWRALDGLGRDEDRLTWVLVSSARTESCYSTECG